MSPWNMKSDFSRILFAVFSIVLATAAEELLPKPFGVGFPVLLACALYFAMSRPVAPAVAYALAAGAAEDAISSLPFATGSGFFAIAALAVSLLRPAPVASFLLVPPMFQLWLWIWEPSIGSGVFSRVLASVPVGAIACAATCFLMRTMERGAALDAA